MEVFIVIEMENLGFFMKTSHNGMLFYLIVPRDN